MSMGGWPSNTLIAFSVCALVRMNDSTAASASESWISAWFTSTSETIPASNRTLIISALPRRALTVASEMSSLLSRSRSTR